MAEALAVTLGDQVRLRFLGWPETVKGLNPANPREEIDMPHPKTGQPYKMFWNSRPYVVHAGDDIYIPFELAKKEFGDPRSLENVYRIKDEWSGEDQIIPDRFAEVRRLQNYWQNNITRFREYIPGDRTFLAEGISDLLPNVEVYTMTGERIVMVTDDPYGDTVMVENKTRAENARHTQIMESQAEAIIELRKTNQLLLQKLGIRQEDLDGVVSPSSPTPSNSLEPLTDATVEEMPKMVYNPRTAKVSPGNLASKILSPDHDPTDINQLPVDAD